jgi:hypothetical protein
MIRPSYGLCAVLVSLVWALTACDISQAGIIYDTTTSTTLLDIDVSPTLKQATQFHTTASDFIITEMSLQLRLDSSTPATGSLNWLIYTDNGGLPNLPVPGGPIFSLDVSTLSETYAAVSTGPLNVSLAPSTDYWLVLNGESLSSGILQVEEALIPSGIGSPFRAASYTLGAWSGHGNQAAVGTITAVPEPGASALAVIGAGLAVLMSWLRLGWFS